MKPSILTFIRYYLPGFKSGGPVRSVANMVERLGEELDFQIVTSDRDALDTKPYPGLAVDAWNTVGKARVFYASPANRSVASFARLMRNTPHDILYLNSFFDPVFTLRPLVARWLRLAPRRSTVLAPRGEFSEGALALKALKKRSYTTLTRLVGLCGDLTWQASSEHEAEDIVRVLGGLARRIRVAPNLPGVVTAPVREAVGRAGDERLRVVFLSRVTPKKNLDFALQVLARVHVPVEMNIYGVVDDKKYWQSCQRMIGRLPGHIAVHYRGVIPHDRVMDVLSAHDLFFLPTRGENYGHAIQEALAAGLPVLISDRTPWRHLEEQGVGWDLPLSAPDLFAAVIDQQGRLTAPERDLQRLRSRQYGGEVAIDHNAIALNLALFTTTLAGRDAT